MSLKFYHWPMSRAAMVHWMLEELGVPYEVILLDLRKQEHKTPEFLAINPMGKVPAVEHDGAVITESAAICCYLADLFPQAGLAVPPGDPQRGPYLRWLFFAAGCLEPAFVDRLLQRPEGPYGALGYGSLDAVLGAITRQLRDSGGPNLLGDRFTAADLLVSAQLRWARTMSILPEVPEIEAWLTRVEQRPALQSSIRKNMEWMPNSAP